ncbi:MAG: PQQ-binding-like beta-propeller repeat protein [Pseudomonadota bacterium]
MGIDFVRWIAWGAVAFALTACSERELILPGEREDVRAILPGGGAVELATDAGAASLPPIEVTRAWTHQAGVPDHNPGHARLAAVPSLQWSTDIGSGDGRRARITASPVSDGTRIYTMDSRSVITAVSTGGQILWSVDVTPAGDRSDSAFGGGLALSGGRLFATTGFGTLVALDAASGAPIWTHNFRSVASGAPTAVGDLVYAVTRNGLGWALRASDGRVAWTVTGIETDAGILGGPSVAVASDGLAVFPFSSGDLAGVDAATGQTRWRGVIAGRRLEPVAARINDMTGDPVIASDIVVAGTHGGRSAAFDRTTGQEVWRSDEGAMAAPVVTGNSIFQVTDRNALVRLERATGLLVWSQPLPKFRTQRPRRFEALFAHFGPILAGGRLVVASDDDALRFYDPSTGALTGQINLPGGAATDPIVVGDTLYVVSETGRLHAFR